MNLISYLIVLAALTVFSPNALAECDDDQGTRDSIMSKCLIPALKKAETKMGSEIKLLSSSISARNPEAKELNIVGLLVESQKNWFAYRDQYCQSEGLAIVGGMSSHSIPEWECKITLTEQRIADLAQLRIKISPISQ